MATISAPARTDDGVWDSGTFHSGRQMADDRGKVVAGDSEAVVGLVKASDRRSR